jgi:hypothetical protein
MKPYSLLVVTSLLTLLLLTFHLADDVVRGLAPGGLSNITVILISAFWLYGALILGERLAGRIVMLLGGVAGTGASVIHVTRAGMVGGRIAHTDGMRFWVWTLLATGAFGVFSGALAVRELWLRRSATGA